MSPVICFLLLEYSSRIRINKFIAVPCQFLITFAVAEEARHFQRLASEQPQLSLQITGMGARNAERTIRAALAEHKPETVLTCGFAGGLNAKFQKNAVIFEADADFNFTSVMLSAGAVPGRIHCVERVVTTAAEKRALWESTGADAVEMESGIIRAICRERRVPSATVRVISDAADENLPLDFNRLMTPDFRLNYAKLAVALVRAPRKISELLRFQRVTQAAAESLAAVLVKVVSAR